MAQDIVEVSNRSDMKDFKEQSLTLKVISHIVICKNKMSHYYDRTDIMSKDKKYVALR